MNSLEIFNALRAGEISLEDAKRKLLASKTKKQRPPPTHVRSEVLKKIGHLQGHQKDLVRKNSPQQIFQDWRITMVW